MNAPEIVHPSIAEIPEEALVEILLSDRLWRADMFEVYGVPRDAAWKTRIPLASVPGQFEGDIDVLLCDPAKPEEAVAYEVKRVKFGMAALREGGRPNKLGELNKAIEQANRLAKAGFWKVFLYVIVVVDSREQNAGKITYQGLSARAKSMLESNSGVSGLDARVGYSRLDFTQPMDRMPLTVGMNGMQIRRMPTGIAQPNGLTQWVKEIFSKQ